MEFNTKDIKSVVKRDAFEYPVMESFYTIQGEGKYQGHAAYFIRLGGCDVGCHWCDVKESWPVDTHPIKSVATLLDEALAHPGRLVVITGGEPLMHEVYLYTAIASGVLMVILSFWVVANPSEKASWVLFKFSSPYLAVLFIALMVDSGL